jgi:probable O-glycosylation ligase (exosortase A-associated)
MEATKFIVSGGGHRIAGFYGHVLGDRNDLSVAINMCIPLIVYLLGQTKHKPIKFGLVILLILNIVAVVGTYSRGGFVGLIIVGGYFFLKSKRKFLWTIMIAILIPILSSNAPTEWTDRMDTVREASTDSSFVGRLWAWKISVKIANDNFFGNGFYATQDPYAWKYYGQNIDDFGFIYTPPMPEDQIVKAAHSIYFQVLGDLGYLGLLLLIMMVMSLLLKANKLRKLALKKNISWCANLCAMLSISSIGFALTGANVSLAYFDLFFTLLALLCVIEKKIIMQSKKQANNLNVHNAMLGVKRSVN